MKKTNAARLLDAKSIHYDLAEYEVDETDLSAITLAKKISQDVEQILMRLFQVCSTSCSALISCLPRLLEKMFHSCSVGCSADLMFVPLFHPLGNGTVEQGMNEKEYQENGGWGGIRTHETLSRLPVFKTGAFNRSATHPHAFQL